MLRVSSMTARELSNQLHQLDGRPYPAYKDLRGRYEFGSFTLSIDRVQGDPFAAPSRLSIEIDHKSSQLPNRSFSNRSRRIGTENFLALAFSQAARQRQVHLGSGKSGLIRIDTPGQEMLERSCLEIGTNATSVRFSVGLPANGRRILGRAAAKLLVELIPEIVAEGLQFPNLDAERLTAFADANEDADALRAALPQQGLVAFIADGAVLPRASGIDQRPLQPAVPFESPSSLRVTLELPSGERVQGMGIPTGVTLIVGGGYHGKSTLLAAIERGVYNHRPGDGRERVVTCADATKVRAEDGRAVAGVDMRAFINNLPSGKDTAAFSSEDASGSTSQAASIIEAIEAGARALLIDEDISATNFLIRDVRMSKLIAAEKEPITPFVQRVRGLYEQHGVSTILVLGGSGEYFAPAHRVIGLDNYRPLDLTDKAKTLCERDDIIDEDFALPATQRIADASSISPYKGSQSYRGNRRGGNSPSSQTLRTNVKAHDTRSISFGSDEIDLSLISQIVDPSQARAIGAALLYACQQNLFADLSIAAACKYVTDRIAQEGLAFLRADDLAAIRPQDLTAAVNRLRALRLR